MSELVHYDLDDGIATITLDSPHNRNALSRQLVAELTEAVERAIADRQVRAGVLAATGPAFCSGADLSERSSADVDPKVPGADAPGGDPSAPQVMERLMTCDLPFVARVHGPVRAGGTGIVAACDVAIAATSVTFAIPEVHLGLVPAIISIPISRVLDRRSLRRYFLTGEPFDAAEAARIGLVTQVTDDLDGALERVLGGLRKAHPAALRRTKQLLQEVEGIDATSGFQLAGELSAHWFATVDAQEGIRAVLERRDPTWR